MNTDSEWEDPDILTYLDVLLGAELGKLSLEELRITKGIIDLRKSVAPPFEVFQYVVAVILQRRKMNGFPSNPRSLLGSVYLHPGAIERIKDMEQYELKCYSSPADYASDNPTSSGTFVLSRLRFCQRCEARKGVNLQGFCADCFKKLDEEKW